jgi:hypothetical protein
MKLALVERLDNLATVARRLQHALGAERPDALLSAELLCQLATDVDHAVNRLEHLAGEISSQVRQRKGGYE